MGWDLAFVFSLHPCLSIDQIVATVSAVVLCLVASPSTPRGSLAMGETDPADFEDDDLSADGPIARRIRAELAALDPLPDQHFAVAQTDDKRGRGLFVAQGVVIQQGTYIFDYDGQVLEQPDYDALYPEASGVRADYAIGILRPDGSSVYVDAADPSQSNLARYINHADADAPELNCRAWTQWDPVPRVMLYALRDLQSGEELLWNYGEGYWDGREDKVGRLIVSKPPEAVLYRLI